MCVGNFSSPQGGLRRNAIFLCVCMSVYLPLHWLISKTISSNFTWFLLSAMQYVLYFWFCRYLFLAVDLSPIKGVKRTRPSGEGPCEGILRTVWLHSACSGRAFTATMGDGIKSAVSNCHQSINQSFTMALPIQHRNVVSDSISIIHTISCRSVEFQMLQNLMAPWSAMECGLIWLIFLAVSVTLAVTQA